MPNPAASVVAVVGGVAKRMRWRPSVGWSRTVAQRSRLSSAASLSPPSSSSSIAAVASVGCQHERCGHGSRQCCHPSHQRSHRQSCRYPSWSDNRSSVRQFGSFTSFQPPLQQTQNNPQRRSKKWQNHKQANRQKGKQLDVRREEAIQLIDQRQSWAPQDWTIVASILQENSDVVINAKWQWMLMDRVLQEQPRHHQQEEPLVTVNRINAMLQRSRSGPPIQELVSRLIRNQDLHPLLNLESYRCLMECAIAQQQIDWCPQILSAATHHHPQSVALYATLMEAYIVTPGMAPKADLVWQHIVAASDKQLDDELLSETATDELQHRFFMVPDASTLVTLLDAWLRHPNTAGAHNDAIQTMQQYMDYCILEARTVTQASTFLNPLLSRCMKYQRPTRTNGGGSNSKNNSDNTVDPSSWMAYMMDGIMTHVLKYATHHNMHGMMPNKNAFSYMIHVWSQTCRLRSRVPYKAPEYAEHWLRQMQNYSTSMPGVALYASIIAAWEKLYLHPLAPHRAEALLHQMIASCETDINQRMPTRSQRRGGSDLLLLSLWSKCGMPHKADGMLRDLIEEGRVHHDPISPIAFANVMTAWRKHQSPHRVQEILDLLIAQQRQYGDTQSNLSDIPFNVALQAWGATQQSESIPKINAVLEQLHQHTEPTITTAWVALEAYEQCMSHNGDDGIPSHAFDLIHQANRAVESRNRSLKIKVLDKAFRIWQHDDDRCQQILQIIANQLRAMRRPLDREQTMLALNALLILSSSNEVMARSILDIITQNSVLHSLIAWSHSGLPERQQHMDRIYRAGLADPNREFLSACLITGMPVDESHDAFVVLSAYADALDKLATIHTRLDKAIAMMHEMVEFAARSEPTLQGEDTHDIADIFVKLIAAATKQKRGDMVDDVWGALARLQSQYEGQANLISPRILEALPEDRAMLKSTILQMILNQKQATRRHKLDRIQSKHFDIVLDALVRSDDEKAGKLSESIFLRMQQHAEDGHINKPKFSVLEKVLRCWSKSPNAAERAENILRFAETLQQEDDDMGFRPSPEGYVAVIHALSNSTTLDDAPQRILGIIAKIQSQDGFVGIDQVAFNQRVYVALFRAYANQPINRNGEADDDAAAVLFAEIPERHRDTEIHNAFLATSSSVEQAMQRMQDIPMPNLETYNAVLQVWHRTQSDSEAVEDFVRQYIPHPNKVTVEWMMKIRPDDDKYLQLCEDYCVGTSMTGRR